MQVERDKSYYFAALQATQLPPASTTTCTSSKKIAKITKEGTEKLWQRWWDRTTKGRWTYQLQPIVVRKKVPSTDARTTEVKIMRMLTGQTKLKANMHRALPHVYPSPTCDCEMDRETVEHVLLHCSIYMQHREKMVQAIEVGYAKTNTQYHLRDISLTTLLGTNPELSSQMKAIIKTSVVCFIATF